MEITLRPYQEDLFNGVQKAVAAGQRSILVVLPCRAGKTPLATYITKLIKQQQGKVLFQVHRTVLLKQTSDTFNKYDIPHGLLSPNHKQTYNPVQVGTIGTIYNRIKKIQYPNIIISDEAHRDKANTREFILKSFPQAVLIGLTATPVRLSGESLGDIYDTMIEGPTVEELINQGYLTDYILYCPPSQVDVSGIKTTAGDYNLKELAVRTNSNVVTGDAIKHYKKLINGKQTVCFCVDISHAVSTAEEYTNEGIPAKCLHSKLSYKEQQEVVEAFVNREIQVITNVDMITEGYDCPGIDAVQILRKTMSLALHIQICTRGMTIAKGKEFCYILDHVGNTEEHGPVDMDFNWSLTAGKKKKPQTLEELQDSVPNIKICKDCWHTYKAGIAKCPLCGSFSSRPPQKITTVDTELIIQKTINNTVRRLVGENKTQGVSAQTLKERMDLFKANGIPNENRHYVKIEKRYDTMKARSPEEIFSVAIKWNYSIHWTVNRYIQCNRMVGSGQAYNVFNALCKQYNIKLKDKK